MVVAAVLGALVGCASGPVPGPAASVAETEPGVPSTKQIGPLAECRWEYRNGLEPFRNSTADPGFDAAFNPAITVSRRGLTARVVGVLSAETLARFGGRLDQVVATYPYLTPVRFVAEHRVRAENLNRSGKWRAANPAGEVEATEVVEWPENTVMILYPVSVAAPGYNTAAGNWRIELKSVSRPNDDKGDFGRFPFLKYTWQGHALHGPITGDRQQNLWTLRRGRVSHGCNRMEGEHVVELSALLGCPASGIGRCTTPNERVTVLEDFDYLPDPDHPGHQTGIIDDYAEIYAHWVAPDVAGVPRETASRILPGWRINDDTVTLERTLNKVWRHPVPGISDAPTAGSGIGAVRLRAFLTWNNLDTDVPGTTQQHVRGVDCAP